MDALLASSGTPSDEELRKLIIASLKEQGFEVHGRSIDLPPDVDKEKLRQLHAVAVKHRIAKAEGGLRRHEAKLLRRLANGDEVVPERIEPRLVEVKPSSEDELLFRYASLHWSIPVSSGYGRRLRFLVVDNQNDKLIGLFGLGDPVFSLAARDQWIGWDKEARRMRLSYLMDAFVLGAVPPYSLLLCGKLVAMLVASNEVREAFSRKYRQRKSLILERPLDGQLAMITTTSALGRSSIYNRLRFQDRVLFESVGFTRGYGEFQFFNGLYDIIMHYAHEFCKPTAKQERWGTGFRNRREVVKKCLTRLGLSTELLCHRIQREIFVVPLAANARQFLRGEETELRWFDHPVSDLFAWFRERWLLPRARRDPRYRDFSVASYRLWEGKE